MSGGNGNSAAVLDPALTVTTTSVTEMSRKTKVVALVGTATSSRDLVHEQGEDVEVWGLNGSYDWMPRFDRWFEVHDRDRYNHIHGAHLDRLASMECPVYMARRYDDVPASVAFPFEEVMQGGHFRSLFTSSVAYMLALAIAEGFTEIRLMGIDMAMNSEYAHQRSACEYWIGIAEALGIKVIIPGTSPLGRAPVYGVDAPENDRMIVDWQDRIANEKNRKYEEFVTKIYQIAYEARVEQKAGRLKGPRVLQFVEMLQEYVDETRVDLAAVEGARQILAQMKQQDGG